MSKFKKITMMENGNREFNLHVPNPNSSDYEDFLKEMVDDDKLQAEKNNKIKKLSKEELENFDNELKNIENNELEGLEMSNLDDESIIMNAIEKEKGPKQLAIQSVDIDVNILNNEINRLNDKAAKLKAIKAKHFKKG